MTHTPLNPKAIAALKNALSDTRALYKSTNAPEPKLDFAIYMKALVAYTKSQGLEKCLFKQDADIDLESIATQIPDRGPTRKNMIDLNTSNR